MNIEPSHVRFLSEALETNEFEVHPLAGDASTRKYFRVTSDERSWVLMSWDPFDDVENYPFLSVLKHFQKHDVHVPKVHKIAPNLGLVLLEDLGDLTLERKFWENLNQEGVLPFYNQAVDELIKIHFAASKDQVSNCTAFKIQFDTEKLLWEMNYGREHLIEKLAQVHLSRTENDALSEVFLSVCQKLDAEPKRISHRDYHSRNVMIKLGSARVIDFQDARMGPVQYDLVSLICDSYVQLSEDSARSILNYYFERAKEQGQHYDLAHFQHVFQLQTIQRCFKACGSFASFYNMRSDTRYLKYLHHTIHRVAETLSAFPQYKVFESILRDHGLLDKEYDSLCAP